MSEISASVQASRTCRKADWRFSASCIFLAVTSTAESSVDPRPWIMRSEPNPEPTISANIRLKPMISFFPTVRRLTGVESSSTLSEDKADSLGRMPIPCSSSGVTGSSSSQKRLPTK